MDRQIVYIGQVPYDTDILNTNLNSYIGFAKLAQAIFGTNTIINALPCTQNGTPNMTVNVGAGEIYQYLAIDTTAYGSLAANPDVILKQGINLNSTNVSGFVAPSTAGYSTNFLVEFTLTQVDNGSEILNYYNSTNPAQSYTGPQNDNVPNLTNRANQVGIQVKAGTPAPTGTQTTPAPDSGYVGGYVVTVANGQVSITNSNIAVYASAPFISNFILTNVASQYGADTSGVANTITVATNPGISAYTVGTVIYVKVANTNTGASTINVNGLGAKNIKYTNGNSLVGGEMFANGMYVFQYDGTNFELQNPFIDIPNIQNNYNYAADTSGVANTITAPLSPAPSAYTAGMLAYIKIANSNTGACTLNLNGLGAKNIKYTNGNALVGAEMSANGLYVFEYDGTNFQLLNPIPVNTSLATISSVQNTGYNYAQDVSGSANTLTATLAPLPTLTVGMVVFIKIANSNTGASTLNLNSLGAKNIKYTNGNALVGGEMIASGMYAFEYDGTNFQLLNPIALVTQSSVQNNTIKYAADTGTANAYVVAFSPALTAYTAGQSFFVKITNANTGASTINVNGLGAKNIKYTNGSALVGGELPAGSIAEFSYDGTNVQLLNPYYSYSANSGDLLAVQTFPASGTYTPTSGMKNCRVRAVAGGGGGGGANNGGSGYSVGGGGGGGAFSEGWFTAATIGASKTVTIGAGGTAGGTSSGSGGTGGTTSLGSLLIVTGGNGGTNSITSVTSGIISGGSGGVVSTAGNVIGISGSAGTPGIISGAGIAGSGGASHLGGSVLGPNGIPVAGSTGLNYGSGGSGASTSSANSAENGGAGSAGYMVIEEFQ